MAGEAVAPAGRRLDRRQAGQDDGACRAPRRTRCASVIADAIEAGGSSLRDHIQTDGSLGYFQHRFKVYDKEGEPCPRRDCNGVVSRIVQSGRSTFYCPVCQR